MLLQWEPLTFCFRQQNCHHTWILMCLMSFANKPETSHHLPVWASFANYEPRSAVLSLSFERYYRRHLFSWILCKTQNVITLCLSMFKLSREAPNQNLSVLLVWSAKEVRLCAISWVDHILRNLSLEMCVFEWKSNSRGLFWWLKRELFQYFIWTFTSIPHTIDHFVLV
jgi:hypothetical protein